jgi:hypothetical protein
MIKLVFAGLLEPSATLEKNDDRIKEHDRLTSSIPEAGYHGSLGL